MTTDNAKALLEDRACEFVVPVIVLAEACWMSEYGKISIPTVSDFLRAVDADPRVVVVPLDRTVLDKTVSLTAITEMHDRQIVATALLLGEQGETVAVITKDTNLHDSPIVLSTWAHLRAPLHHPWSSVLTARKKNQSTN